MPSAPASRLLTWTTDTFAYASAYDEQTSRYVGLTAGQHAGVVLDATAVIVKSDVATRQMDEDRPAAGEYVQTSPSVASRPTDDPTKSPTSPSSWPEPSAPSAPKRFYGRVTLEPIRVVRDIGEIAEAIVTQLGRADASVTINVEIEATAEGGFSEDIRRTVDENARTLKFNTHEFEEG